MKKRLLISIPVVLVTLLLLFVFIPAETYAVPTDGWYNDGWDWYYYKDGEKQTGWLFDNGKWYYLEPAMVSRDMRTINGNTYYFYRSGAMGTGWISDDMGGWVAWFYATDGGALQKDWQKIGGKWYFFDLEQYNMYSDGYYEINGKDYYFYPSGAMGTGWIKAVYDDVTYWYHADSSGVLQTKWQKIGGKWYYFSVTDHHMHSDGFYSLDGDLFYLSPSGAMVTGWIREDMGSWYEWYYAGSNGVIQTGWQRIGGKWYYFDPLFQYMYYSITAEIDGKKYLFDENGVWVSSSGWKEVDGYWYYLDPPSQYLTGWQKIGGKWYYFHQDDGWMVTGGYVIYGYLHLFNSSGVWTEKCTTPGWHKDQYGYWFYVDTGGYAAYDEWKTINGKKYYFYFDGIMAYDGCLDIDAALYYFTESGALVSTEGWYKDASGFWYYVYSNGKCHGGWLTYKGKKYYLDPVFGYMYADGYYWIGDHQYKFDKSGALIL